MINKNKQKIHQQPGTHLILINFREQGRGVGGADHEEETALHGHCEEYQVYIQSTHEINSPRGFPKFTVTPH